MIPHNFASSRKIILQGRIDEVNLVDALLKRERVQESRGKSYFPGGSNSSNFLGGW